VDAERPGGPQPGYHWSFTSYGEKENIEQYAQNHDPPSELVYLIQTKVSVQRFEALLNLSSNLDNVEEPDFHFLTPDEREFLEEAIGSKNLRNAQDNGLHCVARCSVPTNSGYALPFEGDIEDDGTCIQLRTP